MKETKEAVLALFKVINNDMIDRAPKMGEEYASRAKVKKNSCNLIFDELRGFKVSTCYF